MSSEPGLRIELFPADINRFVEFYVLALRFEMAADRRTEDPPYVYLQRGGVRIGALQAWEEVDSSVRSLPGGTEIVIEVDDLVAERDAIVRAGRQIAEDITRRPWGLQDFRLFDPDGYYIRFTTRS